MVFLVTKKNWPVSGASVPPKRSYLEVKSQFLVTSCTVNFFVVGMWTVKHSMISADLTNYFLLPKKLESVQPSSMADQVTWSPKMSSLFAIFPVNFIGHHLRPSCCHHHGNHHCHHCACWCHMSRLLWSISQYPNISIWAISQQNCNKISDNKISQ